MFHVLTVTPGLPISLTVPDPSGSPSRPDFVAAAPTLPGVPGSGCRQVHQTVTTAQLQRSSTPVRTNSASRRTTDLETVPRGLLRVGQARVARVSVVAVTDPGSVWMKVKLSPEGAT